MIKLRSELTNKKVGRWTVLHYNHTRLNKRGDKIIYWLCRCDCGVQKPVLQDSLIRGHSMGCRHCGKTHGQTRYRRKTSEYNIWTEMKQRCTNPKNAAWRNYGGRGITVCESWFHSFENFLSDMGPRPHGLQLDRINNNGNYEPGNCRWTTASQNLKNKRARAERCSEMGSAAIG